jgi:hypothetical protein
MFDTKTIAIDDLRALLQREGFAFVDSSQMRALLERAGNVNDWASFAASWNDLALDTYLVDHGRFRRRRHAVFSVDASGKIRREAHQPHYQSRDYNSVYGGIERWFEPIAETVGSGSSFCSILHFCTNLFGALAGTAPAWRVEAHQFRIEARAGEPGLPTPEGVHRDGVDYVLVLLVARHNIARGTTTIHAADGAQLGNFTLTEAFDAALVDDARVCHGVTPVEAIDASKPAYRDVLVVTFKRTSQ